MKKYLLLAGVACFMASGANAAELNPYVSAKATYSDMNIDGNDSWGGVRPGKHTDSLDDNVWGLSVAAGVSTPLGCGDMGALRTEVEFNTKDDAKKHLGADKATLENDSVMLNVYYDINTGTDFTPYVGAGVGMAHLKAKYEVAGVGSISDTNDSFAWQVGGGVAYAVTENVALDLGYRYSDFGNVKKQYSDEPATYNVEADAHEVLMGARYSF